MQFKNCPSNYNFYPKKFNFKLTILIRNGRTAFFSLFSEIKNKIGARVVYKKQPMFSESLFLVILLFWP